MSKSQIELMQDMSILRSEIHNFDESGEKTIFEKNQLVDKHFENFLNTNANIVNKCENDTFSNEYNNKVIIFINLVIELKKLYHEYETFEDVDFDDVEEKFDVLFKALEDEKFPKNTDTDDDSADSLRSKFNSLTSRYIKLTSDHKSLLNKIKNENKNGTSQSKKSSFETENKILNETVTRMREKLIMANKVNDDLKSENEILNKKLYDLKNKTLKSEKFNYNIFANGELLSSGNKIVEVDELTIEDENKTMEMEMDELTIEEENKIIEEENKTIEEENEELKLKNDELTFNLEKMKQLVNAFLKL